MKPLVYWSGIAIISAVFSAAIVYLCFIINASGRLSWGGLGSFLALLAGWFYAVHLLNRASREADEHQRAALADEATRQQRSWTCPACAERVDEHLGVCWNCGADRAGAIDPSFEPAVSFHPQCESCGHILIGATDVRCPECGATFDPEKMDTPRQVRHND